MQGTGGLLGSLLERALDRTIRGLDFSRKLPRTLTQVVQTGDDDRVPGFLKPIQRLSDLGVLGASPRKE